VCGLLKVSPVWRASRPREWRSALLTSSRPRGAAGHCRLSRNARARGAQSTPSGGHRTRGPQVAGSQADEQGHDVDNQMSLHRSAARLPVMRPPPASSPSTRGAERKGDQRPARGRGAGRRFGVPEGRRADRRWVAFIARLASMEPGSATGPRKGREEWPDRAGPGRAQRAQQDPPGRSRSGRPQPSKPHSLPCSSACSSALSLVVRSMIALFGLAQHPPT